MGIENGSAETSRGNTVEITENGIGETPRFLTEYEQPEAARGEVAHAVDAASSALNDLQYAERQGATEMNVGIGTDDVYTGLSRRLSLGGTPSFA